MNPARICLLIFFLTSTMVLCAIAQDKDKPGNKPDSASSTTEAERPKSEVQLMLDEAMKRGEPIMGTCLEKCVDPSSGKTAEGVETGRALELPQPVYPPLAARAHVLGEVQVQVIVGLDGKVIAASAISGHPLLRAAAVKAARGSVFTPMKFEGKPVKIVGVISYNFVTRM